MTVTLQPGTVLEIYRSTTDRLACTLMREGKTKNCFSALDEDSTLTELQPGDNVLSMQADSGVQFKELKVDGGASANNLLMQFQADIAGVTVRRPMIRETTALGAAYLAGLATGVWRDLNDIKGQWTLDKLYEPQMETARARELVDGWHKAVERARGWA